MIAAALLLAAAASGAVAAERDFAALAQSSGQWTAFRAYAADEALMFTPAPVNAQQWLRDRTDPPVPVMWWPGRSWQSCDGTLAVNTGPWLRQGGRSSGTFTTVWRRQADGSWKWLLDHGRTTPKAVGAGDAPKVERAACSGLARAKQAGLSDAAAGRLLVQTDDAMPADSMPAIPAKEGEAIGGGASDDGSLRWETRAVAGAGEGAHTLRVWSWDGDAHRLVLFELSGVPAR